MHENIQLNELSAYVDATFPPEQTDSRLVETNYSSNRPKNKLILETLPVSSRILYLSDIGAEAFN